MLQYDKMINEMTDLEADLLMPFDLNVLDGYFFAMENVNEETGNWLGYIVLPDDREVAVAYNASTAMNKYRKDEAYYDFADDAKVIFPLDSCAIDTMVALLAIAESEGWDDGKDY